MVHTISDNTDCLLHSPLPQKYKLQAGTRTTLLLKQNNTPPAKRAFLHHEGRDRNHTTTPNTVVARRSWAIRFLSLCLAIFLATQITCNASYKQVASAGGEETSCGHQVYLKDIHFHSHTDCFSAFAWWKVEAQQKDERDTIQPPGKERAAT